MNSSRNLRGARAALPLFIAAFAAGAQAQDAPVTEIAPVVVQSRRFEEQRIRIAPSLGASTTEITRETIERLPQGGNASLNQVLLQAPGVVQAPQGDLHVRGDHRNLQFRINGVLLPEAISGFAQLFDARGLRSVSLITGALPAQFGYRTAGIVDLRLRSGAQDPGGSVAVYGGAFDTFQPSLNYGTAIGPAEFYVTASYLRNSRAFENPTGARQAIHNESDQIRGLFNFAYNLSDRTRLAVIGGTNQSRFEVPNIPGPVTGFPFGGITAVEGAGLRARQTQRSSFGVVALQHALDAADIQVSAFVRQTQVGYRPDVVGDLLGLGVASRVSRFNWSYGVQGDAAWRIAEDHTLRAGFFASEDATTSRIGSQVLPLPVGDPLAAPLGIAERSRVRGRLFGLYIQDEWRISDRLTLNFGGRFDVSDYQLTETQFSPRVNLVWRATDTTTVAFGYARYFTPPPAELLSVPDLARYAGTTLAPQVPIAGPVRAERAHYFNAGIRQRVGESLTLGAEAFFREARNMQDLGQFGAAYLFSPYNYRRGQIYGTELSASWRSGPWLAYANFTVSRSLGTGIRSNQYFFGADELAFINSKWVRTDHDQRFTGSAGVSYRPWEGGNVGATLVAGSGLRRGFANTQSVAPYGVVNLALSQEFEIPRAGRWTVRADLLNLFDTRYVLRDGSGIGVGAPQFGIRRGFFVGLSRAI
jgi:outer membrane receptor protein involved in Fe transport